MKKFLLLILCFCMFNSAGGQEIYVIKNATIIPVTSENIYEGTIIIEGNKIAEIGKNLSIPSGAQVIDGTSLYVYPGMINAYTVLGLYEIGAVGVTVDSRERGTHNAFIKAATAINPHSVHIPITRVNGITSALVVPSGSLISGQSALINLHGWTADEMILNDRVGIHLSFPNSEPSSDFKTPTKKQIKETKEKFLDTIKNLNETLEKARVYAAAVASNKNPPEDLLLEALVPVIKNKIPLIISVNKENDIKEAIKFVTVNKIRAIFYGAADSWKTADLLGKNNIPVIIETLRSSPGRFDPYDASYSKAAILHKSGVKFAFATGGAPGARNLPYHAGKAAAFGLPKEEALKGVTIYPAEILGAADEIGSLESGKTANVVVTDGDILEIRTQIKHLFINGQKIELTTKHTKLYEKFRRRP